MVDATQKNNSNLGDGITKSALFFSPFGRILPHAIPEATLAYELKRKGYAVTHITCGEFLKGQCVVLDAYGLNNENLTAEIVNKTCQECTACAESLFEKNIPMHGILEVKAQQLAESEISRLIAGISPQNFAEFEYEGLCFGKIAGYQHLINFKKFTPHFDESEFPVFLKELEHCLWVFFALKTYSSQNAALPDVCFVYNSLYSVNAVFRHFYEQKGVRVVSLHAGANLHHSLDSLLLMEKSVFTHISRLKDIWPEFASRRLTKERTDWVIDHFKELAAGKSAFAYSAPAQKSTAPDIRKVWHIPAEKKICLAAMSSYDERFAAEFTGNLASSQDAIFVDQIEWIKAIKEFAASHKHIHFIIRLHPREFPNKRESVQSKHAELVIEALRNHPENLTINTPADDLSLYDIAREVDLALTSWSSVSKELMLLGIPVVLYTADSQWYPATLAKVGRSRSEYFELIEHKINEGWSVKNSINVFKWLAFETIDNTFRLTTKLSSAHSQKPARFFWRVLNRFFGPTFFIRWRIGRITEHRLLYKVGSQGRLPVEYSRPTNAISSKTNHDLEIAIHALHKLGEVFFGDERHWPSKFKQMLTGRN